MVKSEDGTANHRHMMPSVVFFSLSSPSSSSSSSFSSSSSTFSGVPYGTSCDPVDRRQQRVAGGYVSTTTPVRRLDFFAGTK